MNKISLLFNKQTKNTLATIVFANNKLAENVSIGKTGSPYSVTVE